MRSRLAIERGGDLAGTPRSSCTAANAWAGISPWRLARILRLYTYIMYVDGSARELTNVSCEGSASAGFTCSSLLPSMSLGRHTLTLVAPRVTRSSAPSPPSKSRWSWLNAASRAVGEGTPSLSRVHRIGSVLSVEKSYAARADIHASLGAERAHSVCRRRPPDPVGVTGVDGAGLRWTLSHQGHESSAWLFAEGSGRRFARLGRVHRDARRTTRAS